MALMAFAKRLNGMRGALRNGRTTPVPLFRRLPVWAATFNPELAYRYGIAIGEEARYRRKDILLGAGRKHLSHTAQWS